ncbi:PAS domain S-box protein [Actinopolymorpha sp. B11F2]|uniref:PAS domain S-box protein n=1 Tax=Actinopolymorpha sp. B11F2 TaxID=3160862 RepID=UPI0032E3F880
MATFLPAPQDPASRLRELEAMIDAISSLVITKLDIHGRIVSWSPGGQAMLGYTDDEVLGQPVSMFYTEEDRQAGVAQRELAEALRSDMTAFEGVRVRKNGEQFWAGITVSPIRDDTGRTTAFVQVMRDLSRRRHHEAQLHRQRDEIVELSTPVLQIWDRVLVLPIIGTLNSLRTARLTEAVLNKLAETRNDVLIIDVSGVPVIDTNVSQHLLQTVQAAALMGTVSILSGVRAEVAQAMVRLGVDLGQLRSSSSLRDALLLALRHLGERGAAGFSRTAPRSSR